MGRPIVLLVGTIMAAAPYWPAIHAAESVPVESRWMRVPQPREDLTRPVPAIGLRPASPRHAPGLGIVVPATPARADDSPRLDPGNSGKGGWEISGRIDPTQVYSPLERLDEAPLGMPLPGQPRTGTGRFNVEVQYSF